MQKLTRIYVVLSIVFYTENNIKNLKTLMGHDTYLRVKRRMRDYCGPSGWYAYQSGPAQSGLLNESRFGIK